MADDKGRPDESAESALHKAGRWTGVVADQRDPRSRKRQVFDFLCGFAVVAVTLTMTRGDALWMQILVIALGLLVLGLLQAWVETLNAKRQH